MRELCIYILSEAVESGKYTHLVPEVVWPWRERFSRETVCCRHYDGDEWFEANAKAVHQFTRENI